MKSKKINEYIFLYSFLVEWNVFTPMIWITYPGPMRVEEKKKKNE